MIKSLFFIYECMYVHMHITTNNYFILLLKANAIINPSVNSLSIKFLIHSLKKKFKTKLKF